ncbi:MAG TPA: diaminopimelate epimerase [Acidimicrobiia bacterium]|jgi:diaminopimelate epimerase
MTAVLFAKYHATGNDFLVTASRPAAGGGAHALTPDEVVALCDRHRGIGADGVITVGPADAATGADCTFALRNADGGEAEMSGNGMRCLAAFAAREGIGTVTELLVHTPAGRRDVALERDRNGVVIAADVDMGRATFDPARIPFAATDAHDVVAAVDGARYCGDAVGMGNPHLVLRVDDVESIPVAVHGPVLEHDKRFPQRTNVEWVAVRDRSHAVMRVWERGAGETLSCGTGACAAGAALRARDLVDAHLTMHVPGGDLAIELGDTIRLGGPVVHVFDVEIDRGRIR